MYPLPLLLNNKHPTCADINTAADAVTIADDVDDVIEIVALVGTSVYPA
jgi:hypothetical protein